MFFINSGEIYDPA